MGQTTRPVITSGTVAAGGILISGVAGAAFIDVDTSKTGASDFSTAILAAVKHNDVIEITSKTSGQKIYGYAKAAGIAEGLSDELIGNTTFADTSWWSGITGNWSVSGGKLVGNNVSASINKTNFFTLGALYKRSVTITKTGGSVYAMYNGYSGAILVTTVGSYWTGQRANPENVLYIQGVNFTGTVELPSIKQVTAPSANGITLTNSPNGLTYNLGLSPATPNTFYNDAAGYTYRIIASGQYSKLITSASVADASTTIVLTDGSATCNMGASPNLGVDYVGAASAVKYKIVLQDTSGKTAVGFAGEAVDTTGAKIYSGNNSTQNWFSKDAGFNADSDPMLIRIYRYVP